MKLEANAVNIKILAIMLAVFSEFSKMSGTYRNKCNAATKGPRIAGILFAPRIVGLWVFNNERV
jgi:hypothetical protein